MDIVRAQVERVEVVGLDEAYLDLDGLLAPRAAMRRLVDEIRAATGLDCSVGIGPNRLVAKVASDAEKPRGFVVLTREEACARFGSHPPGLVPGIGPKTVARLERHGHHDARARWRRAPPEALTARVRRQPRARPAAPRALRGLGGADAGARRGVGVARDDVRHRHRRPRAPGGDPRRARRAALRAPRRPGAPRAHHRDQGAPRRLHDGHACAHDRRVHERSGDRHARRARAAARVRAGAAGAAARRARGGVRARRGRRSPPTSSRCRCSVARDAEAARRREPSCTTSAAAPASRCCSSRA